ncbi:peptidylprolyl isomerase [Paenibacillus thailandensis]|uniref:Foldase protein PrsA n=1 Tax=Paenibacillus thailandensis TaxID=393250 RepID=A0ABW5R0W4_9BACL
MEKNTGADEKEKVAAQDEQSVEERQDNTIQSENRSDTADEAAVAERPAEAETAAAAEAAPAGAKAVSNGSKVWMAISAVLAIALVVVLVNPPFSSGSDAVANVNGDKITKDELYDEMVAQGGSSTLGNMITMKLIEQAADDAGVTVTDADIDAEVTRLQDQVGGADALDSMLMQYNMTMDDLREESETQVIVRKILEPQANVTDQDIEDYYNANKDSFATPEQVRASHILVATKEEAEAIKKQLDEGADFATLAEEKSTDTASAANGGDLGFFGQGDMVESFSKAAFALELNEISEPVQSDFGYHIIKKTDYKAATNPTLEEKKEEIRNLLVDQKVAELSSDWISNLRAQAKITNTLDPSQNSSGEPAATATPETTSASEGDASASASPETN